MKKFLFIIFLFLSLQDVFADIIFTNWDEEITFTDYGREVFVSAKAKVKLEPNYYYKEWSYIFDPSLKVEIVEAKVTNKKYMTFFGKNNDLKFKFDDTFDGQNIEFQFKYIIKNEYENEYIRSEYISLPKFAKNAVGVLKINIPEKYIVYSINDKFKKNINETEYSWVGKIPQDGFKDYINLTLKRAKWNVNIANKITVVDGAPIKKIDILIPQYFKNGNSEIEKMTIKTNYDDNSEIINNNDSIQINFNNINTNNILINIDANLTTSFMYTPKPSRKPSDYLKIDSELSYKLKNFIYNRINPTSDDSPIYISIGKWVYNHIKYTENLTGKNLDTMTILKSGLGVCSHYAQLYRDLLRSIGIPTVIVAGESWSSEKKWESHAWNLVYYNNEWIQVDPTWDIFSGKMPISHILFYIDEKSILQYTIYNTNNVSSNLNEEISKIVTFIE